MKWTTQALKQIVEAMGESRSAEEALRKCNFKTSTSGLRKALQTNGYQSPTAYLQGPIFETPVEIINSLPGERLSDPKISVEDWRKGPTKLYVVVSDVHVPSHSRACVNAITEFLKDAKPHGIIFNGDMIDLIEVSRHSAASVAQLEGLRIKNTFAATDKVMSDWLEAAGPQCRDNHFIDGNHEDRLKRWMERGDNAVWMDDSGTQIGKRLNFFDKSITHHTGYPTAYKKLGRLIVTHGVTTSKYHAAAMLDKYRNSILYGHTHRPQVYYGAGFEHQQAAWGTGHLADPKSRAMKYAPTPNGWQQGFALVFVEPSEDFHVQLINFVNGRFFYAGKRYGVK